MASDLYIFDGSLFSDPFSLFPTDLDSSLFQTQVDENNNHTNQMKNLSLSPYLPCSEVKTEDQFSLSSAFGSENVTNFNYSFEHCFVPIMEFANFHPRICENGYANIGQMRKVCSTGDLHSMKIKETSYRLSSSLLGSYIEESIRKVGRYSAEERKERIMRYKAKRTQRNFKKTIKYACRKTLADNRPRIHGRFARHDEPEESVKTATSSSYHEEYDLWINAFNVEEEIEEGSLFSILGSRKFEYCSH